MSTFKNIQGKNIRSYENNAPNATAGEMWYNRTEQKLKGVVASGAWSSTSPMINSVQYRGGGGTPTAMFAAGGSLSTNLTEEYNGSGWSAGGNIGTARYEMGSAGTLTAGLIFGGYNNPPGSTKNETEEYNGTSWSEQNNLNTTRYSQGGFGIQTAAVYSSGFNPAGPVTDTEEYNGTSWSEGNNPAQARYDVGTGGTLTAGIIFGGGGATAPVVYANTELYDGTNWTAGPAMNTARSTLGGSGTQTAAIGFGGRSTPIVAITEQFDGTSWTEVGDLATARRNITANRSNTGNSEAIAAGGSPGSGTVTLVEQWNFTANTITAAAWSSGGNLNTARRAAAGFGTQTAAVVAGGNTSAPGYGGTANSEEYNGASWAEGNNMNTPRANINSAGYGPQTSGNIVGGAAPSTGLTNYETYDGTDYSNGPALNTGRFGAAAVGTSTAGLCMGGYYDPGGTNGSTNSEEYGGSSWAAGNAMNTARYDGMGFGTQTAGAIAGGYGTAAIANVEEYYGTSWTNATALANPQRIGGSVGTQTDALIFGGLLGPSETKSTLAQGYDGTTWSSRPSMATARIQISPASAGTSVLTLAAGGNIQNPVTNATEEFTGETTAINIVDITTS